MIPTLFRVDGSPKVSGEVLLEVLATKDASESLAGALGRYALDAERKMGEMLKETERAKGTQLAGRTVGGHVTLPPKPETPTLAEIGVTKRESVEAQRLAALPAETFEQVRGLCECGRQLTGKQHFCPACAAERDRASKRRWWAEKGTSARRESGGATEVLDSLPRAPKAVLRRPWAVLRAS